MKYKYEDFDDYTLEESLEILREENNNRRDNRDKKSRRDNKNRKRY